MLTAFLVFTFLVHLFQVNDGCFSPVYTELEYSINFTVRGPCPYPSVAVPNNTGITVQFTCSYEGGSDFYWTVNNKSIGSNFNHFPVSSSIRVGIESPGLTFLNISLMDITQSVSNIKCGLCDYPSRCRNNLETVDPFVEAKDVKLILFGELTTK